MADDPASRPSRRGVLRAVGGGAAATTLAGCTGPSDDESVVETSENGNPVETGATEGSTTSPLPETTLRVATERPRTLDPIAAVDEASKRVVSQLYEPLFSHPNGALQVEPALSKSVSVSEDFETYRFELREDATFHDGTSVTAEDVVYSFERAFASEHSKHGFLLDFRGVNLAYDTDDRGEYVPGSVGVEAVGEHTVRLRLAKPFAWTLDVLALPALAIVPRGAAGDVDVMPAGGVEDETTVPVDDSHGYEAFATSEPVGTGPFALESRNETELRLERFADYREPAATVGSVEYRTFEDASAAYEYAVDAEGGDEPDVFPIPRAAFERAALYTDVPDANGRIKGTYGGLSSDERLRYQAAPSLHTEVLCLNAERVSRPVRRALADVLRQRTLVDDAFGGRAKPAVHLTPPARYPGGAAAYREHADAYPYGTGESRVADARERLDAAGFDDASPAIVTLALPADRDGESLRAHLRGAVDPIPVQLETQSLGRESFEDEARNGRLDAWPRELGESLHRGYGDDGRVPGVFAGAFLATVVPQLTNTGPEPPNHLAVDWDWGGGGPTDAAERYTTAWKRYTEAVASTDAARARRIHAVVEMEEALWTDVPVIPLYHRVHERFHREDADIPPFGALGPPAQTLDDVAFEDR